MRKKIFLLIISIIIIIPSIMMIFHIETGIILNGVTVEERPICTIMGIMDGSYQQEVDTYYTQILGGREAVIKVGNQLVYSLFHKSTHAGESIGKNGQIYELEYIYNKLQYVQPVEQGYIDELFVKLELLQEKLEKKGIRLFIFVTPSKAEIYPEDISDIFYRCAPEQQVSTYDKFSNALQASTVPYFDSVPYVEEMKKSSGELLYAKTGTHWKQVTGARVAARLAEELEKQLKYDMTDFYVTEQKVDVPVAPDADIFNLLNIIQLPYDDYTEPVIQVTNQGNDQPSIFCRGGSFMGQSIFWLVNYDIVGSAVHMENTYVFQEKYTQVEYFSEYDEINVGGMLENKDVLLLEVNQEAIDRMSFGFIDYLLDSNILD